MGIICEFIAVLPKEFERIDANLDVLFDEILEDERRDRVDVDKTWDAFHFLFAGTSSNPKFPQNMFVGGAPFGDDDDDELSNIVYFEPAETVRIAKFLAGFDREKLGARYVPEEMTNVYPEIWRDGDRAELFDGYLWPTFEELRIFFAAAAKKGAFVVRFFD